MLKLSLNGGFNIRWSMLASSFAFLFLLLAMIFGDSQPAYTLPIHKVSAVPAFARKYGLPCSACHTAWPKLNDFGIAFRDRGYQIGNDRDSPIWQNPSYFPVTARITPNWHFEHTTNQSVDSIPGGGAEILDDEVRRKIARLKCMTEDWLLVHRVAHRLGMRTTSTMMFGVGESYEHRVNHFQRLFELQQETGGFTAFIPWTFQPQHTALGGRGWDEATAVDYLKTLAIARLFLDNIENVQSSWVTQGLKVCQVGLRFGGNDVGSVMIEENVVRAAGTSNCTTEEELRRMIRDAGFRPVQRDTLYRTMFLN